MIRTTHTCSQCGETKTYGGFGAGYATNKAGGKVCFECCAIADRADMIATGKATLYLTISTATNGDAKLTNWPGTLQFVGRYSVGKHNIARKRYDVAFRGPDSFMWSGTQYGDNTQICHCRRTKKRA